MEKFLYAGSFDPFTLGHLDIVLQALQKYGSGVIAIGSNPKKEATFASAMRKRMIEESLLWVQRVSGQKIANKVKVVQYSGLTINAAHEHKATVLIRGVRNEKDREEEQALAEINAKLLAIRGWDIKQDIIVGAVDKNFISSSAVKQLCAYGEYIAAKQFVVPPVHNLMMEKYLFPIFPTGCLGLWIKFTQQMNRPYHNLSHIACMINRLNIYSDKVPDYKKLVKAIFFHDYVPDDIEASVNEYQKFGFVLLASIEGLLWATDHFGPQQKLSNNEELIRELDLSVLFEEAPAYDFYKIGVRLENKNVPLNEYIMARLKVLKKLQGLISFPLLGDLFKAKADENIKNEIVFWQNVYEYGLPEDLAGLK